MSANNNPFFIVGSPRSGTTLLRFILSSHPRLYIPEETGFIPFIDKNAKGELTREHTAQILQNIGRLNYLWKDLVSDVDKFYLSLPEPTLKYVLDSLYKQIIQPSGAERWGDKTPLYIRYIPQLMKIFPEAQFIHLIRDGRDCTLSAKKKWGSDHFYMDNYYLLSNWVKNVNTGIDAGKYLSDEQYIQIRYEDLVFNPHETILKVCEYLREDFTQELLDHTPVARQVGPGQDHHIEVLRPINEGGVYRWKKVMSTFDKKMSEHIAGPTLRATGYESSDSGSFTSAEWIKIIFYKIKYFLSESIRSMLYALNIITLNRNMRRRKI
jgi:hypothetical protein